MSTQGDGAIGASHGVAHTEPPQVRRWTLDDVAEGLRAMRSDAGHPSYAEIAKRIGTIRAARGMPAGEQRPARATVYDCFRTDRRRLDVDLVVDIVRALGGDDAEAARWAQACRVAQSQADAATVVTAYADLPSRIDHFVARHDELTAILDACDDATTSRVLCIDGMPGSGKTQLAIKAARRLLDAERVEGVLHADLRGYHPDSPPADPAAVLDAFLRLLDVPAREIPGELTQRQALLHKQLAGRRHVIVLDDASGTDQVLPLIPATPGSVVLVTSRAMLHGATLGQTAESVRISLGVFSSQEALALLREVAGADLVDSDVASAAQLVEASGCLPLAVGLTATRVAAKTGWTLADHLEPLLERRRGLRLDDAIEATLELSYAALSPSAQATLRFLATHPCTDLDPGAVAALTGSELDHTRRDLDQLSTQNLVTQPRPGRYGLHALVQTYALDRSYDDDRPAQRDAAVNRLCDHHVALVWAAHRVRHLTVGYQSRRPPEHVRVPDIDESSATAWLDANIENVLTLAGHAPDLNQPDLPIHLSEGTAWWLILVGRHREGQQLHQSALDAARSRGNQISEARAGLDLGQVLIRLNDWDGAATLLRRAEHGFDAVDDLHGACSAVNALAIMDVQLGRLSDGIDRLHRALELNRAMENSHGAAIVVANLGVAYQLAGRIAEAVTYHQLGADEAEKIGDGHMQAVNLSNLSDAQLLLGAKEDAFRSAQQALAIARQVDNASAVLFASTNVGRVLSACGEHDAAIRHHHEALAMNTAIEDRQIEATITNNLGDAYREKGDAVRARRCYDDAYAIGTDIDNPFEQGRALNGIATILAADGALEHAREHWTEALAIFDEHDPTQAAEIRDRLARRSDGDPLPDRQ